MKIVALTTVGLLAAATPALAQPVPTQTFENGNPAGFTFDTSTGGVSIANGAIYAPCCGTDPNDTNNFVAFGGGPAGSGTLRTSFNTVAGQLYTVAFDYAALGGGSEALNFFVNSVGVFSVTPTAQNRPIAFQSGTFSFLGFGGTTELAISSTGTFGVDAILDNLSVSGATAAVPEPATWGLMILGFGAIGAAMRRRTAVRTSVTYA